MNKVTRRLSNQNGDVTISWKISKNRKKQYLMNKVTRRLSNQNGDVTISKKFLKIEKSKKNRLMILSARRR
jgi:hypothetical protein